MIFINNPKTGQPIIFQTVPDADITEAHLSRCPFGVGKGQPGDPDKGIYDLTLHITNPDFIAKIKEIDSFVGESAVKNFPQWFGKPLSSDECRFLHKKILQEKPARPKPDAKPDEDPGVDYFIKVKVTGPKGKELNPKKKVSQVELATDCSELSDDAVRKEGTLDDIINQSRVTAAIELSRMWYMDKTTRQFGVTLEAKHLVAIPPKGGGSSRVEPDAFNFGCHSSKYVPSEEVDNYLRDLAHRKMNIASSNNPIKTVQKHRQEGVREMSLKERYVQNKLAREEGIDPAEQEFRIEAPGNKWRRADIYRHKGRYETNPELIEIKTWENKTDAIGQLLHYETLLLQKGNKVGKKRIHLFDVPDDSTSQHELHLYTEGTCKRQKIHVTSEGIVTIE